MGQDGLSIVLAVAAVAILASGLWRGSFEIQFIHAGRAKQPGAYWTCAAVLVLVAAEAARRALFVGCTEC